MVVGNLGKMVERNDYYPFGTRHIKSQYPQTVRNHYKYNGKEEQITGNLGYLDYEARMDDSKLARWMTIDPVSESSAVNSPYSYCNNNPLMYIAPNGERLVFHWLENNGNGTTTRHNGLRNSQIEHLWEIFASTELGYNLLSLYANKGQTIGGITFEEDGLLYFIDLIIYDFEYWGKLGSFQAEFLYKNKKLNENELNFRIEMSSINTTRKNDVNGFANYLVTLGHEMFIHMEQWYVKYLVSFLKNDKKEFDRLMDISNKDGGDYDHSRYINGNENYKFFNTYLQQLKKNEHIANNAKINR